MEPQRPEIDPSEFDKPVGSDMPERKPLPLLPDRVWLRAVIEDVAYQVAMFNNQVQYLTDKNDAPILDEDGNKIMRKEFNITFVLPDYKMDNGEPRKAWLRMGASMGEKAHLPVFLFHVLGKQASDSIETPGQVIRALKGREVKLQLSNKPNKDRTRMYQNVVYDAVQAMGELETLPTPGPMKQPTYPAQPQPIDPKELDPTQPMPGSFVQSDDEDVPW